MAVQILKGLASFLLLVLVTACGGGSDSTPQSTVKVFDLQLDTATRIEGRRMGLVPVAANPHVTLATVETGPQRYIDLGQSVWVDPGEHDRVLIKLHAASPESAGIAASASSSDETVVAMTSSNRDEIALQLTGQLGNSYITVYDAGGNAVEKVMILVAKPRENVAVVDTANFEPVGLAVADGTGAGFKVATDFKSSYNLDLLSKAVVRNGNPTAQNPYRFKIRRKDGAPFDLRTLFRGDAAKARALYFEKPQLLIELNPGESLAKGVAEGDTFTLSINSLVAQDRWADFMDDGGHLSSSPLLDMSQPIEATLNILNAYGSSGTDSDGEATLQGLSCRNRGGVDRAPRFNSMLMQMAVSFAGDLSWNRGRPSIAVEVKPRFTAGGQAAMELAQNASLDFECNMSLFQVPLAEIGIPLLGALKFEAPNSLGLWFKGAANIPGTLVAMLPRLQIGSVADTAKAGSVGLRYRYGEGFDTLKDITLRPYMDNIGVVQGSTNTAGKLDFRAGASVGIRASAKLDLWFTTIEVNADIGDVLFGGLFDPSFAVRASGASRVFDMGLGDGMKIGAFPRFAPTITIKAFYIEKSFNLFDINFSDIIFGRGFGRTGEIHAQRLMLGPGSSMFPTQFNLIPSSTCPAASLTGRYGQSWIMSDRWEFMNQNLTEVCLQSARVRVYQVDNSTTVLDQVAFPLPGKTCPDLALNLTGIDFDKLANGQKLAHTIEATMKFTGPGYTCSGTTNPLPWPTGE